MEPFARDRDGIADRDARQAPGRGLVDGHNHDLITSFQEGQRLALDVSDTLKREGTNHRQYIGNASVYRNLLGALPRVRRCIYPLPRRPAALLLLFLAEKFPVAVVIWLGSLLLHVTRNITRQ
jgi:hypothetical protein